MKNKKKTSILILLSFSIFTISSCKKKAETAPDVLKIYELNETVNGKTRNDIATASSKFIYPFDFALSPLSDPDGSRSDEKHQPFTDLTILGTNSGGISERSLTVSAKKPIFFEILGYTTWYYENDPCDPDKPAVGQSIKDFLLSFITPYFLEKNVANLTATLDGTPIVPDLRPYKFTTEAFKMKVPPAVAGDYCPGNKNDAVAIASGYSMLVKLPKGKHILAYKGDILDPDGKKENDFHTEIKWNLVVE